VLTGRMIAEAAKHAQGIRSIPRGGKYNALQR
jgi:hypothetical protein